MLPDLGIQHALLLQGPAGPFMHRFGRELRAAGSRVTKVNFHAGDVLFYSRPDALAFRGTFDEWPVFLRDLIVRESVDGVFAFGDCRPLHRMAATVAEELGITFFAFEEGYLRPDWITLERHGVNGHSHMPRNPEHYRDLQLPEPPEPTPVGPSFGLSAWYSTLNALAFTHLNQRFPHYTHHRNLNAWYHTFVWVRNVFRKKRFQFTERDMQRAIVEGWSGRYFLVPLQVHCDFQLHHSPYDDMLDFVGEVVSSFAQHAPADTAIVFKHHPMDRAYREYGDLFRELARTHDIEGRLFYCHDLHLPTLLKHARGTITINSTVGISSLHHGTPVKTMGTAVYDLPGLTAGCSLEEFFQNQTAPDRDLYEQFRRYLINENQINGNFYKRVPAVDSPTGFRWFDCFGREALLGGERKSGPRATTG